jgi:hypothetical protein
MGAAVLHPFRLSCGVELLPELHTIALELKRKWDQAVASLPSSKGCDAPLLEYVCGSFLLREDCDWTNGDVVFVNSHCLTGDMMAQLSVMAGDVMSSDGMGWDGMKYDMMLYDII